MKSSDIVGTIWEKIYQGDDEIAHFALVVCVSNEIAAIDYLNVVSGSTWTYKTSLSSEDSLESMFKLNGFKRSTITKEKFQLMQSLFTHKI